VADTSGLGFHKGKVAESLRKILYPSLSDHEVEAIVVCLMAHSLIESKINRLIYRWLRPDAPAWKEEEAVSKAEDQLLKNIVKIDFAKKYSLVEPFFAMHFPEQAKNTWKINDLRNDIFHGRAIEEAKFNGQAISKEETVEKLFLAAQDVSMRFDKFEELVDVPHANAERWSKRLVELEKQLAEKDG
jgi:hypothetical protein